MKIKIDINEKYTIRLEEVTDFEDSFFYGVYKSAFENLIEIVESSKKAKDNTDKNNSNSFFRLIDDEKAKDNNIIAFVGERGSGKSSTMISFINAVKTNLKKLSEVMKVDKNDIITKCNFEILDVIDPSLFEKNDNILEIVIAKMFHKFKETFPSDNSCNNDKNSKYQSKKSLLEKFESVYKSIKTIEKNDKYSNEDEIIEEISNLSTGTNLRNNIQELIKEYLNFFSPKKDNNFLVLIIDDFDLNIKHAGEMVELIRKYLFLHNVIIFTALNFSDLSLLIQQDYSTHLKIALKNKQINNDEIKDKSYRYLEKFIPYTRRLFLPEISKEKHLIKLEIIGFNKDDEIIKYDKLLLELEEKSKKNKY